MLISAVSAGTLTITMLKGSKLAVISIGGVSYAIAEINAMINEIYSATSSFDGGIFTRNIKDDYLTWADLVDKWGNPCLSSPYRYKYDWSMFHQHYERLKSLNNKNIKMRDGSQFAKTLDHEMRLFFHIAPGQRALLKISLELMSYHEVNIIQMLFEAVGLVIPIPGL